MAENEALYALVVEAVDEFGTRQRINLTWVHSEAQIFVIDQVNTVISQHDSQAHELVLRHTPIFVCGRSDVDLHRHRDEDSFTQVVVYAYLVSQPFRDANLH